MLRLCKLDNVLDLGGIGVALIRSTKMVMPITVVNPLASRVHVAAEMQKHDC